MLKLPLPVKGCWVQHAKDEHRTGVVIDSRYEDDKAEVSVRWKNAQLPAWLPLQEIRSGFRVGSEVKDVPNSRTRESNGIGVVRTPARLIGGREMHLVDFEESGLKAWMPYETLKFVKSVRHRFETAAMPTTGAAERFRLRNLAYAIENWHENTGALSHLAIDPLPHQIHLVHHILKSGDLNWLIADDVGLGKTIEVGMLLSALKSKREFGRVLLVCPAGLVKQWKDEMHYKFALSDFLIYGEDFRVNEVRDWRLYNKVIASLDMLKNDEHLQKIMSADPWGIIVFDEAHRLSRSQYGLKYNTSDRFRLAQNLRQRTDSLLLLSATPHQGKQDKFQALLELLHPEWRKQIQSLALNPEILSSMVIRNNKADVTDAEGNFIFKGKTIRSIKVEIDQTEREFDKRLQSYLEAGYNASSLGDQTKTKAIGFVMTVYRKLAASSIAAIRGALDRRLNKLLAQHQDAQDAIDDPGEDSPFETEWEEREAQRVSEKHRVEFFAGEIKLLEGLIASAGALLDRDEKINAFINGLVTEVLRTESDKKILVFTEYRATQDYVADALSKRFGRSKVALIHGRMSHLDRQISINEFEATGQFLVSTEAGGEGINLQRTCHVMVNFDLPWNPMRLVQRVGRLYRYGQQKRVVVLNLQAPHTFDGKILEIMYERINQVVSDMAHIGGEFAPGLEDDILGQVADLLDVEDILTDASSSSIHRTEERIADALKKARAAAELQRELFRYFSRYDPDETKAEFKLTKAHVRSFVTGMFKHVGVEIQEELYKGSVLLVKLTDPIRETMGMRASLLRITFDREYSERRIEAQMIDESSALLRRLLAHAKNYQFDAYIACLKNLPFDAVLSGVLRWQNDQGTRTRQEYMVVGLGEGQATTINPGQFSDWLLSEQVDIAQAETLPRDKAKELTQRAAAAFDMRLGEISNAMLHPENRQLIGAAWTAKGT